MICTLVLSHLNSVQLYVQWMFVNKGQMLTGMFCVKSPTSLPDISICQWERAKLQKSEKDVLFITYILKKSTLVKGKLISLVHKTHDSIAPLFTWLQGCFSSYHVAHWFGPCEQKHLSINVLGHIIWQYCNYNRLQLYKEITVLWSTWMSLWLCIYCNLCRETVINTCSLSDSSPH